MANDLVFSNSLIDELETCPINNEETGCVDNEDLKAYIIINREAANRPDNDNEE